MNKGPSLVTLVGKLPSRFDVSLSKRNICASVLEVAQSVHAILGANGCGLEYRVVRHLPSLRQLRGPGSPGYTCPGDWRNLLPSISHTRFTTMEKERSSLPRGFSTRAIHGGYEPSTHFGSLNPPVYLNATYSFDSVAEGTRKRYPVGHRGRTALHRWSPAPSRHTRNGRER